MPAAKEDPTDLGFGAVVARDSRRRLLNRDGSFNVRRQGLNPLTALSLYHDLLALSWPRFLALIVGVYLATNVLFASAYFAAGAGAIAGLRASTAGGRFLDCFFFSVQTVATIGYGSMSPATLTADVLVATESLLGLLGFALITGLLFARFSRPTARVLFSEVAVVAPHRESHALMIRLVNARKSQLLQVEAQLLLSRFKADGSGREFQPLALERSSVMFLPLAWTIVHPIQPDSPLYGDTDDSLRAAGAELLILLSGVDETFSQTVHARTSYTAEEIAWGVRFSNLFNPPQDGVLSIDVGKLDRVDPIESGPAVQA